jgi:hypothetical protein
MQLCIIAHPAISRRFSMQTFYLPISRARPARVSMSNIAQISPAKAVDSKLSSVKTSFATIGDPP